MSYPVIIGIVAVMIALRFTRLNMLGWMITWWVATYILLTKGVVPPVPSSIIGMFMGIVSVALLAYVSSDAERLRDTTRPIVSFIVEKKFTVPLILLVLAIPVLVAFNVYRGMSKEIAAPVAGRTVHPAPPSSITFAGKTVDLVAGHNPYRELEDTDAASFAAHVDNGRRVYYENCVFCHGDDMKGNGIFAHALDPIPANFANPTTIAMLQETYLFWRIAKGAPDLPQESTPWASAMPAWETFLSEEEIWDVILFLYDYTGQRPRALESHE